MGVTVYPQLATLLEERRLTVAELERQIKARFGLTMNIKSLYRLAQSTPVQRADLEIAGAAAAVLGVGLDDLFYVETSAGDDDREPLLGPDDSKRLAELQEQQAHTALTNSEWSELETLVARYGLALHERRMEILAQQRNISLEQAQRESAAELEQARAWWKALETNPERQEIIAKSAAALRERRPD
jgi:transposase